MTKPLRVLVVEDSEPDTELVLRELRHGGFEPVALRVDSADSLTEALNEPGWDVIICDYRLPGFNALAAIELVAESGHDIPIIVVSGTIGEETAVEAMKAGAHDYVMKDNLTRLAPAVERELAQAHERRRRRQADEELHRSERKLQDLFVSTRDAIGSVDMTGTFVDANQAYLDMLGYTLEELRHLTRFDITPERWHETSNSAVRQAIERGYSDVYEKEYTRKDGTVIPISIRVVLIRDEKGWPGLLWGIVRDITEQKRVEKSLRDTTEDLKRSNADLQQFAYIASHDLQEPLRTVESYVGLLARRYKGRLDQNADDFIEFAVQGVTRMRTLINDLLEYSRVETRAKPLEPVEAREAVEAALSNLAAAMTECEVGMHVGALPTVVADKAQLAQVFQNLIGNAIRFRREEPVRISITAGKEGCEWMFRVTDNGIGIEPEYFDRIFRAFERLHTQDEYPGSGIGLPICKKIVERHGGRIWVESDVGVGSTFCFTIPEKGVTEG